MFLCNGTPDPWRAITLGGTVTQRHTRALAGLAGAALVVSLAPMGAQAKDAALTAEIATEFSIDTSFPRPPAADSSPSSSPTAFSDASFP